MSKTTDNGKKNTGKNPANNTNDFVETLIDDLFVNLPENFKSLVADIKTLKVERSTNKEIFPSTIEIIKNFLEVKSIREISRTEFINCFISKLYNHVGFVLLPSELHSLTDALFTKENWLNLTSQSSTVEKQKTPWQQIQELREKEDKKDRMKEEKTPDEAENFNQAQSDQEAQSCEAQDHTDDTTNTPSWLDGVIKWFRPRTKVVFWTALAIVLGLIALWFLNKPSHLENFNQRMTADQYIEPPIKEGTSDLTVILVCCLGAGLIIAYFLATAPSNRERRLRTKAKKKARKEREQEERVLSEQKQAEIFAKEKERLKAKIKKLKQDKSDLEKCKADANEIRISKMEEDKLKAEKSEADIKKELEKIKQAQIDKIEANIKSLEEKLQKTMEQERDRLAAKKSKNDRLKQKAKLKKTDLKTKADREKHLEEKIALQDRIINLQNQKKSTQTQKGSQK